MDTKNRSIFTDIISVFRNNIFILIIGVLTSIILSRYLGPEGRGLYTAILVYPILLTSLAELGIRQVVIFLIGQKKYPPEEIVSILLWMMIASSIISVFIVGFIFLFLKDPNFSLLSIILAMLYIPFNVIIAYSQGIFVGKGEIWRFNQFNWIPKVILLIGLLLLVVWGDLYVLGAVIATLSGSMIMAIYALFLLSKIAPLKIQFNNTIIKNMVSLGLIYGIALFVINLNYKIDIVIMQQLSTASEIGLYTAGVGIAELLTQIPAAVGIVVFSRSANAENPSLFSKSITKIFRVSLVLALICGCILALIAPFLVPLMYGIAFLPSILVIQLIIPGIIMRAGYAVLNMDLAGKGKPIISLIAITPAVIVNILLNIRWIPIYGANGAAMASSVSYSLGAIFLIFLYSKELNIRLKELFRFQTSDFSFIKNYIPGSFR